jgi:aspartate carbamoyltransferase catalytic subunit
MIRGMEITADVADSERSVIVEQVTNGVAVRMAVLYLLLGGSEPAIGGDVATVAGDDETPAGGDE